MKKINFFIILVFFVLLFLGVVYSQEINETDGVNYQTINNDESHSNTDNTIIEKDNTVSNNKKETSEYEEEDSRGEGCCTTIIQGYNNDSAISFRRDATNVLTLNVKHNSTFIKQYKESGSYFFHVLISKDGWLVGNGGADNANVNKALETNALRMINNNYISKTTMNNVYNLESKLSVGHFVIKSPNGTYSLIVKNQNRIYKDSGILKEGQYLVVPNSPKYFSKGSFNKALDKNSMILSSRMLAARDRYGINRREIITYYYKNNVINSTISISATNDNGKYVNSRTANLIDSIQTNTKYFSSKIIPIIDKSIDIDFVNFFIRKAKTVVKSENVTINKDKVELKAFINDEFGQKVNKGFVSFIFNDRTIKNANNTVYVNVTNGIASYKYTIPDIWKRLNYSYYVRYYQNSVYEESLGNKAVILVDNLVNLNTDHANDTFYNGNLSITTRIKDIENKSINGGKVFYKINGKAVKNSLNNTIIINVNKGLVNFNCYFDTKYSAKTFKLTTIYVNGVYRKEIDTYFTIKKIPTKIVLPKVSVNNNRVTFTGKFVDYNDKNIRYNSYACIKINGKTLKDTNNNTRLFNISNGIINFNFNLPGKLKSGNHILSIVIPELRETLGLRMNYTMTII